MMTLRIQFRRIVNRNTLIYLLLLAISSFLLVTMVLSFIPFGGITVPSHIVYGALLSSVSLVFVIAISLWRLTIVLRTSEPAGIPEVIH